MYSGQSNLVVLKIHITFSNEFLAPSELIYPEYFVGGVGCNAALVVTRAAFLDSIFDVFKRVLHLFFIKSSFHYWWPQIFMN